ncbi:MAG: AMP-binding acetyl-CoA synthetase [Rubrivivax sp.]|nr:MAG: AMP-binding acetyl-CoA synthetase [Rubrivivax sp.]
MATIAADHLALQRLYHWERTQGREVTLTQPMGGAEVRDFTWGQVGDQVRRMAAFLKAKGAAEGWPADAKVALLSKNCAWWLMSDLAIWMAGYVSVPLYPTLAADTITQILTHSEARFIFVGKLDGWEGMKPGVPAGLPGASYELSPGDAKAAYENWDAICARTEPLKGEVVRGADELCTLIYTSGTTGNPKGVMHSFGCFAWAVVEGMVRFRITDADRLLTYLPLAHVAERVLVEHGWLLKGPRIFFADSLDTFTADLQRARPTIFFSVPRLWVKFQQGVQAKMPPQKMNRLLRLPIIGGLVRRKVLKALGLDQCRMAVGGAAPMPLALLEWYEQLGLRVNEGYGMTENLALSHQTVPEKRQFGTVGPPYPNVQSRIDPDTGELQMRSPALMLGYFKEPRLTAEALTEDGWLRTGDKATQDADGCVRITGRVKDLFKTSKGKYVAPAPIEDKLGMNPAIEACCVTGANLNQPLGIAMLSPQGVKRVESDAAGLMSELAQHLQTVNAKLDPHEQLDTLVLIKTPWTVDNGFITPTFKVKRNRVEEAYGDKFEGWVKQRAKVVLGD